MIDGLFMPVLERGTVLPASRGERVSTMVDGQTQIRIEVYQGEQAHCSKNQKLGEYHVRGIPPAPAGEEPLDVRFTYTTHLHNVETQGPTSRIKALAQSTRGCMARR